MSERRFDSQAECRFQKHLWLQPHIGQAEQGHSLEVLLGRLEYPLIKLGRVLTSRVQAIKRQHPCLPVVGQATPACDEPFQFAQLTPVYQGGSSSGVGPQSLHEQREAWVTKEDLNPCLSNVPFC